MPTKKSKDQLLAVRPDGEYRMVPCTYEGIKEGLDGATFDFVHSDAVGMYIDDEGMINELVFNTPASIFMSRALWGPVVLTSARTDDEGNTLAPEMVHVNGLKTIARLWQRVLADSVRLGQVIMTQANETTIPPPQIFDMTDEDMERFIMTGQLPDRESDL